MNLLTDATLIDQPAVTAFTSDTGLLCKQFRVTPNGATIKTTHATFSRGRAAHVHTRTPQDLATLLDALDHNQAIAIGTLRDGRRETGVTTKTRPVLGAVARSKEYFHFPPDEPGWLLWDYDTGSMPDEVRARVADMTIAGMVTMWPDTARAGLVWRPSSSYRQSGAWHCYFQMRSVGQIPAALDALAHLAWLNGLG